MKRHNDLPISQVLKQWSQSPKFKPRLIQEKIEAGWEDWFGKTISKNTEKLVVKNNILYVYIKSGPLKYEMNMGREQIRRILHERLGENYFEDIVIN